VLLGITVLHSELSRQRRTPVFGQKLTIRNMYM